jgi:hypothetical protein
LPEFAALEHSCIKASSSSILDYSIGFEFDQPIGIDKPRHLHNCVGGPNVAKERAMDSRDCFPILDPDEKRAGANYLVERSAGFFQGGSNYLETSPRLRCRISDRYRPAIRPNWSCARNGNHIPHANGS